MHLSRRHFLKAAAVAAGPLLVPRHVLGGPKFVAPSETINVALVGAGGQGRSNLRQLFKEADVRVVAVCDPAESWDLEGFYYKGASGRKPIRAEIEKQYAGKTGFQCAEYEDFRVLLDKEKGIDAILCATPDHAHAVVSVQAMRAGKHVYCEKPLTHNIWEARLVGKVAKETGLATQMGNQGHSTEGIRQTVEYLKAGAIGPVREVHAWVGTSRWNKTLAGKPTETVQTPKGLNWDLWLGPRQARPFHPAYAPVAWRDFWAFGCGVLGDFGCHDLDAACWALDLQNPTRVESASAGYTDAEIVPHGEIVYFDFGARGEQPPVRLTWYAGGLKPRTPEGWAVGKPLPGRGVLFVGDKGTLFCGGAGGMPQLLPEKRAAEVPAPKPTLVRSRGHHRDWLDAIKGGKPASSEFGYGSRLTEIVLLGVLALRTGKAIDWDAVGMKARGVPEADRILREDYRKGWEPA